MRFVSHLTLVALTVLACEGPAGPAGADGADGQPGNANVVSGTFSVAPAAYADSFWYFPIAGGTQGNPAQVATVAVPAITADIANNGAVLVYLKVPATPVGASTRWTLLPFHQGGMFGGFLVSIKAAVQTGQIAIGYMHEQTDTSVTVPSVYTVTLPIYEFKYVAMSAVPASAVAAYAQLGDPDRVLAALRRDGY